MGLMGLARPISPILPISPIVLSPAVPKQNPFDQIGCRAAFNKRQTQYFPARGLNLIASDDPFNVPITSLDQHVRQQGGDDFSRRRLIKDCHVINATERRHHFGAFVLIQDWTLLAFQLAHRTVAVERDYQRVSELARRLKVFYMPWMNQIETAVSENHPATCPPQTLTFYSQLVKREKIFHSRFK